MTLLRQLIQLGVPLAIKTVYQDGVPASRALMPLLATKTDRFHRLNGKIVPKSLVISAIRNGIARRKLERQVRLASLDKPNLP